MISHPSDDDNRYTRQGALIIATIVFCLISFLATAYYVKELKERVEALEAEVASRTVPESSVSAIDLNKALCQTLNATLSPSDRQKCD